MMDHDIDSLSVSRIEADDFADFVEDQATTGDLYRALTDFWQSLRCHRVCLQKTMKWKHVANAVNHEMTRQIAECIQSVSSPMGLYENSGDKLVDRINTKTKRILTNSEAKYLRSLVERATNKIVLTPKEDSS